MNSASTNDWLQTSLQNLAREGFEITLRHFLDPHRRCLHERFDSVGQDK